MMIFWGCQHPSSQRVNHPFILAVMKPHNIKAGSLGCFFLKYVRSKTWGTITQMLHVWIIYLHYIGETWPHSRGNVGKYSLHGAYGLFFVAIFDVCAVAWFF